MGTTADKLNLLLNSKADIKAALVEKGQTVSDVFSEYGDKIRAIQTGTQLPALTNPASAAEVGEGYDAINAAGERMVGTGELAVSLAPELTAQDTLIADIMTALEGKAAAEPVAESVEVTLTGCDMQKVYYSDPDGLPVTIDNANQDTTITCLKGSIIVVADTYVTTASSLGNLTSTTGGVITPSFGVTLNDKLKLVVASQSGTITMG